MEFRVYNFSRQSSLIFIYVSMALVVVGARFKYLGNEDVVSKHFYIGQVYIKIQHGVGGLYKSKH